MSVDFFLKHKLSKGFVISQELFYEIERESLFVETYVKANTLLSRQLYSEFNLKRKLLSKDYDVEAIERTLEFLQIQGRINDESFSEHWLEQRIRNKLDSYNGLLSGLLQKGISIKTAKTTLNKLYTDEIAEIIIKKSIVKFRNQGKDPDRILTTLTRKGFNRRTVIHLINSTDHDDL